MNRRGERWPHTRQLEIGLAVSLAAFSVIEALVLDAVHNSPTRTIAVAWAAALALPWRRRRPVAVAAWMALLLAVPPLVDRPADGFSLFIAALLTAYSVGADSPTLRATVEGLVLLTGGTFAGQIVDHARVADYLFSLVLYSLAAIDGHLVRRESDRAAEAFGLAGRLEALQDVQLRQALSDERARIAREMHDVISHSVTLMVIQAGAAQTTLETKPLEAQTALATIQDIGAEAVSELRRLLGVLRNAPASAPTSPHPSIKHLPELVEMNRKAGLDVTMTTSGVERRLLPGVDAAAFRIAQEGLTNARKHAPGCAVTLQLRFGERDFEIIVEDDGQGPGDHPTLGHGLIGMKERTEIYGGRFAVESSAGGGMRVSALFRITEVPA